MSALKITPGRGLPTAGRVEPRTAYTTTGSVTHWINALKSGDQDTVQLLWNRYFRQLVERARKKLCALRSPMAVKDEEDVALSAFHSLCEGLPEGVPPARPTATTCGGSWYT